MAKLKWTDFIIKLFSPEGRAVYVANDATEPLPIDLVVGATATTAVTKRNTHTAGTLISWNSSQDARHVRVDLPVGAQLIRSLALYLKIAPVLISNPFRMTPVMFDNVTNINVAGSATPIGVSAMYNEYFFHVPVPPIDFNHNNNMLPWDMFASSPLLTPPNAYRNISGGNCSIGVHFDQISGGDSFYVTLLVKAALEMAGGIS